jgi:membrane-associated protein
MEALLHFITDFGWLAVVLVIFAESGLMVGFFLPGDSLLFVAGTLVQRGIFDINIGLFIVCLFIAAVLGNSTGYLIGRKLGRRLFKESSNRFFRQEYLLEAESFYTKHGPKTVVLAMFIPIVRAFAPVVAGIAHMSYQKFVAFNLLGAAIWTTSFTLIGYIAGDVIQRLGINIEIAALIIIFLSLLPGIIHVLQQPEQRAKLRSRAQRAFRRNK